MGEKLNGKKVAFLATDGVEQVELTAPWKAVEQEGGQPELVSLEEGEIQGFEHLDKADTFEVHHAVSDVSHAPWTMVEADVVRGRKLTSWPSLQTDIRNAGGEWVDEEVVVDAGLVTSRKPDDPAFCDKAVEEICEGRHEERAQQTAGAAS